MPLSFNTRGYVFSSVVPASDAGLLFLYLAMKRSRAAFRAGVSVHFRGHLCTICCPLLQVYPSISVDTFARSAVLCISGSNSHPSSTHLVNFLGELSILLSYFFKH